MNTAGLIPAFRKGTELRQEIFSARETGANDHLDIWWLGQSGFLLQWNGQCLLFDPYLSDSLTTKYSQTSKPHVRMSELVITPEQLDMVDIVTSSHNHTDHLDAETLNPLLQANPELQFIIPEANRDFVCQRLNCRPDFPIGLSDSEKVEVNGITIHGIPAAHNTIERDTLGRCKFMGFVVACGDWSIYHSGDTLWYDGMVEVLKPFEIDLAFLPINGNDPSRGVAGNLSAVEAAQLGREIGARLVIPHHYHMFEFNTANPADFIAAAQSVDQPFRVLQLGEHFLFSKP